MLTIYIHSMLNAMTLIISLCNIMYVILYRFLYVSAYGDGEEKQCGEHVVVGDQLSVERGVNGHMSLANGFIPDERGNGLHFEIADWHAGNKFLEVQ